VQGEGNIGEHSKKGVGQGDEFKYGQKGQNRTHENGDSRKSTHIIEKPKATGQICQNGSEQKGAGGQDFDQDQTKETGRSDKSGLQPKTTKRKQGENTQNTTKTKKHTPRGVLLVSSRLHT